MQPDIVAVVEEVIVKFAKALTPFTALDVSNTVKEQGHQVRHREVAPIVRDVFESNALSHFDYTRALIEVTLQDGRIAEAFLYYPEGVSPDVYTQRSQQAIPVALTTDDEDKDGVHSPANCAAHTSTTSFSTVTHHVGSVSTGPTITNVSPGAPTRTVLPANVRYVKPWADKRLAIPRALLSLLSCRPDELIVELCTGAQPSNIVLKQDIHSDQVIKRYPYQLKPDGRVVLSRNLLKIAFDDQTPTSYRVEVFQGDLYISK